MDILIASRLAGLGVESIAFASALYSFRYHDKAFRAMFYLLLYIVVHESVGMYINLFCSRELQRKAVAAFNIYIVTESIFIYLVGRYAATSLFFRRIIAVTTGLFFFYCALNIYFNGFFSYPTAPLLLFAVNGLVIFLGLLILQSESRTFFKQPIFYLSLGMVVFYGCTMPYYSVVNYFAKADNQILKKLAQILFISNYIRYILTTVAYIILHRQQKAARISPASSM